MFTYLRSTRREEETPMINVSTALASAGYSWSASGKDGNGDGDVTREEFKLPVAPGTTSLVPADLKSGGSLDDAFDAYDADGNGKIDASEIARGPRGGARPADRMTPNWAEGMTTEKALAFLNVVNRDNAALAEEWGLKLPSQS